MLGVLQGPTELLPVSSSGHLVLVPKLLDWPYADLDPELRKSFEVALHAGTAVALLIGLRAEVAEYVRDFSARNAVNLALSFAPAALVAWRFERLIERRLGEPLPVALALVGRLGRDGRRRRKRAAARARRRRPAGRARDRRRPGLRARAWRLAQRRHADGGAPAADSGGGTRT